jgi:hypothetical protein
LPPQTFISAHAKKTTTQLIAEILADIAAFDRVLTERFLDRSVAEEPIIKDYIRWKLLQETTLEKLRKNDAIISKMDPNTAQKQKILISKKKEFITKAAKMIEQEIDAYFKIHRTDPEKARRTIGNLQKMFETHEDQAQKTKLYQILDPLRCNDLLNDTRPPNTATKSHLIPYPTPTFDTCDRN